MEAHVNIYRENDGYSADLVVGGIIVERGAALDKSVAANNAITRFADRLCVKDHTDLIDGFIPRQTSIRRLAD